MKTTARKWVSELEWGGHGEGEEPNTQSGLFLKRAAAGGEENSKWHADLVPGPEGLQGVRCWIYTA